MRVIQIKKSRIVIPTRTIVPRHLGHPRVKHLDDPRHLGKFQKSLSARVSELNHVLLFQGMSKIKVHCYKSLLNT